MWVHLYVLLCHSHAWKYEWEQCMKYVPLCSHCESAFPLVYIACTRTQTCTQLLSCLFLQKIRAFESIHSIYSVVSIISNRCTRHICWNDPQTQWKVRRSTVFPPKMILPLISWERNRPFWVCPFQGRPRRSSQGSPPANAASLSQPLAPGC